MSNVSYWSLIAMTTPWSGPNSLPVCANWRSCAAATSNASGMVALSSTRSVRLRALRSSKPHVVRVAGRRLSVESALMCPAFAMVVTGPRMPCGSLTQVPL
jgi:hypothetical protein